MNNIDTLRLILGWECNLTCPYCCNRIPEVQAQFRTLRLDDINFEAYANICLTGGEPLVMLDRLEYVAFYAKFRNPSIFSILYTNGALLTKEVMNRLQRIGIRAMTIGLHQEDQFDKIVSSALSLAEGTSVSVRFNVWEKLADKIVPRYPEATFKLWVMDACDRANEDRVVLAKG